MDKKYENFKLNAIVLGNKLINIISLHEHMVIELTESPTTGYSWHYTTSDPSIIILEEKVIYDFNKPNILGGSKQIIWKFKCLNCGECKITFSYYKSWKKESCFLDELTYIIKVQ
ncbi:protease inhibitor I42 family protein [Clostridium frigoris]|uniref:Protease inhibitor I42 family protein n=1 Tax=Clostridium frigoris TaxID=205327 RepID=A0ABS6BPS4_9CLOT|nr:protease inhibitor I42 family protein [Clostridium frigoris]MBU3158915.1 protease inhibitor I42 family protein [Clostridium frigoris]